MYEVMDMLECFSEMELKMQDTHLNSLSEYIEMPKVPNNTQLYQTHESDCDIQYIKDNFSFILWRITPNGRLSFMAENLDLKTCLVDVDNTEKFSNRHRHAYIELAYVCKGTLSMEISGKQYTFQQGEVFIIDRNCIHSENYKADAAVVFLCMSETFFDEIFLGELKEEPLQEFLRTCLKKQKQIRQFVRFSPIDDDEKMYDLVSQIIEEIELKRKGYNYLIKGLMMRIMDILVNSYNIELSKMEKQRKDEILFRELEEYLLKNFKNITSGELITKYHYNEDYFNRLVKKYTDMTFSQFLQSIRLSKAEEMLVTSKLSVNSIINEVGYQNKGYFYKIFIQRNGITPKEFRCNHKI